jgi:hypothetical protein
LKKKKEIDYGLSVFCFVVDEFRKRFKKRNKHIPRMRELKVCNSTKNINSEEIRVLMAGTNKQTLGKRTRFADTRIAEN